MYDSGATGLSSGTPWTYCHLSVLNAEVEQLVNGAGHHFTRRHIRAYVRGAFPALQLCAARAQSFVVAGTSQFASADEREDGSDTTTLSGKILAFP